MSMPREEIDLRYRIDYLSILDADGGLDEPLAPDASEDLLLRMHRAMLLARRFDERMLKLQRQRQRRLGTFAPVSGQEASQIGAMAALRDDGRITILPVVTRMMTSPRLRPPWRRKRYDACSYWIAKST
jgi:hypothetical protein